MKINTLKIKRNFIYLFLFSWFVISSSIAQNSKPNQSYQLIAGNSYVQSKNYYFLTLIESLPEVKKMISNDTLLQQIAIKKSEFLKSQLSSSNATVESYTTALKFSDFEINAISNRLLELYQPNNAIGKMVNQHLAPSGCYILFQNTTPKELLVKAWEQDAKGINFCIGVYGEGNKPNYPLIDSISFRTKDVKNPTVYAQNYKGFIYNVSSCIQGETKGNKLFFSIPIKAATEFLELNEREQAGDFEPMTNTENKAAINKVKKTEWNKYKYSVIVIPGAGPDDPKEKLSAEGMIRCRLAAIQYKMGLAPFIMTSGGKVHPYKTQFCEATEMKLFLIQKLNIPESAIIVDPHARHTTTNMRNASRLMYRYGFPFNKPGITCTTRGQSYSIGTSLIARCLKELNEVPYRNGIRLSETEIEFYPLLEALHINPLEPIDP